MDEDFMDFEVEDEEVQGEEGVQQEQQADAAVDPLIGHAYLTFPEGSPMAERCDRLLTMQLGGHLGIMGLLETVGEDARARDIVGLDTLFSRLFPLAMEDTYREITVEFLSSFTFAPGPPVNEITFYLTSQQFGMSLAQFVVHSGLYTEPEIATVIYTEGVREMDRQTQIAAKGHCH
ncbi:hypothetical protein Hdeb2414_s0012g00387311 [Helianthus debilis subsp. tardiflorus]